MPPAVAEPVVQAEPVVEEPAVQPVPAAQAAAEAEVIPPAIAAPAAEEPMARVAAEPQTAPQTEETPPAPIEPAPESKPLPEVSSSMMEELLVGEMAPASAPVPAGAAPAGEPPSPFIKQALERLAIRPDDHEMRLTLARAWRDAGRLDAATEHYAALIEANQHLDSIVSDLEKVTGELPAGHASLVLLGDAYMKQGRLSDALSVYRRALGR
jgi:tetratricopeptide (TPR) repeat protein